MTRKEIKKKEIYAHLKDYSSELSFAIGPGSLNLRVWSNGKIIWARLDKFNSFSVPFYLKNLKQCVKDPNEELIELSTLLWEGSIDYIDRISFLLSTFKYRKCRLW